MDEKRCSTCQLIRPLTDFNVRRRSKDGRQSRRKSEVRAIHQGRLTEYLLVHPCVDCGECDLRVLDFDHDDASQKVADVARLASMHIAWGRVEAEIAKCSVRCADCHRRRTADMFGYWRAGVERQRAEERHALATGRLEVLLGGTSG